MARRVKTGWLWDDDMLAILTSKLGLAGIALVLILSVFGIQALRLHHAEAVIAGMKAAEAAAAADAKAHEARAAQISTAQAAQLVQDRTRVQTVTRTLIQKVPEYVPADADRDCVVPRGWVRLHDAAAAGVPGPAGGPDQAASGVSLSAVAATVVANYGVAYDWKAEALSWRAWYVAQAAAWNAK